MNTRSSRARLTGALLLTVLLAGCAGTGPHWHQPGTGGAYGGRGGMQDRQGMMMDMQAMCDMHAQQTAGKSPQERQALMDEQMRSMPPEMRQRMQMMLQHCR